MSFREGVNVRNVDLDLRLKKSREKPMLTKLSDKTWIDTKEILYIKNLSGLDMDLPYCVVFKAFHSECSTSICITQEEYKQLEYVLMTEGPKLPREDKNSWWNL